MEEEGYSQVLEQSTKGTELMKNKDLTTVFVIMTKDYENESGVRVVQVVDSKRKTEGWCGEESILNKHYWYQEVALD